MERETKKEFALPEWLRGAGEPPSPVPSHSKAHFLRKTMRRLSEVFENEFFSEQYAGKPMLLQILDPRVKMAVFLSFLLLCSFAGSPAVLLMTAGVALLYARQSGLKSGVFLRRVWLYVPSAVFLLSLPGATNLLAKDEPLFRLLRPGVFGLPNGLYFTRNGLEAALRPALRAGVSLSFAFLLLLTTRWSRILAGLAALRVPQGFLAVCGMAYRYLFVLSAAANEMLEARLLRTTGKLGARDNRRFVGHSAAHLFLKSHALSEEVYGAMLCRGFSGKQVSLRPCRISRRDILFLCGNALILLILIAGEILF